MDIVLDIIAGLIGIITAIFWLALMTRSWKALGLAISILEVFLENQQKVWDTLNTIRTQHDTK